MDETGEVKEGFLCPMCMKDLGTQLLLQSHFVEAHSIGDDQTKTGQNVKGILDKAKRKILGRNEEGSDQTAENVQLNTTDKHLDFSYWEPQDIGFSRDRTREFRNLRGQTNDDVIIEINTILIRLEKILKSTTDGKDTKLPGNSAKKAIERSVVPWMSDNEVKNCFGCKKSFTVARRKHHCRLCGHVICGKCSEFLPLTFADMLCTLDAIQNFNMEPKNEEPADEQNSLRICSTCDGLLIKCVYNKNFLYCPCSYPIMSATIAFPVDLVMCNEALDVCFYPEHANDVTNSQGGGLHVVTFTPDISSMRHYEFWKEKKKKLPIVRIYEKLTSLMSEADLLLPDFNKMAESLSFGDTRYLYQEVLDARMKLLKIYEALELLSKKVLSLGRNNNTDGEPVKLGIQSEKLKRGVHAFVTHYLQNNMFTLKSLPSEQEYEALQAERSALLRRRAEREKVQQDKAMKERALMHKEALRRGRDSKDSSPLFERKPISTGQGQRNVQSDPLLEQINNVKTFLSRAKEKGDFGEISALESNLNELQIEYNKLNRI